MPPKPRPIPKFPRFVCPSYEDSAPNQFRHARPVLRSSSFPKKQPSINSSRRHFSQSTRPRSQHAHLTNKTLIRLRGPDAATFLFNLLPANILNGSSKCIYTAFLSAQGRISHDVFIYPPSSTSTSAENKDEWLIEVDSASAGTLLSHLRKHKLRAKFQLQKIPEDELGVYYFWPSTSASSTRSEFSVNDSSPGTETGPDSDSKYRLSSSDPRPGMGTRILANPSSLPTTPSVPLSDYTVHRILQGHAEGQSELPSLSSLPQESNLDFYHSAIDFHKGCYLGQELTIRTHHTGVVRKRVLPVQLYREGEQTPDFSTQEGIVFREDSGVELPPPQSNISKVRASDTQKSGPSRGRSTGKFLGGVGNVGLALCRLEMMTDIQLVGESTGFDPSDHFCVTWEDADTKGEGDDARTEGEGTQKKVMLKPLVPDWLRTKIHESLTRRERRAGAKNTKDDVGEENVD